MADGTVHFKIRLHATLECDAWIEGVRIRPHVAGTLCQRLFEDPDVSIGAELVVRPAAVKLMFTVHLRRVQTQHESRCTGVTEHALVAAGIVPHLLPDAGSGL